MPVRPRPDPLLQLALVAGRATGALIRRVGRGGGTTLPGRVSVALDSGLVSKLASRLEDGVILVTGTNGKTTTANLLGAILSASGYDVVSNRAGANLMSGIASALIGVPRTSSLRGRIGIFEVDEASLPKAVEKLRPRIVVVNNLFRDQLDRYGELESSAAAIERALRELDEGSVALLCGDDPGVTALAEGLAARVQFFGVDDNHQGDAGLPHYADAKFCPHDGEPLDFSRVYVGHLGHYACPNHDFARRHPDFSASGLQFDGISGQSLTVVREGGELRLTVPLSGLYNTYNITGAAAAALVAGVAPVAITSAVKGFRPAFGRLETVEVDGRTLRLLLAKNPAGFNEVLRTSTRLGGGTRFLLALNDRIADGRDVSWIWDTDFELLGGAEWIVVSGTRALDLEVRLKYAGIPHDLTTVHADPAGAIDAAVRLSRPGDEIFVLPTYTAMLDLRAELARRGHLRPFWEAA